MCLNRSSSSSSAAFSLTSSICAMFNGSLYERFVLYFWSSDDYRRVSAVNKALFAETIMLLRLCTNDELRAPNEAPDGRRAYKHRDGLWHDELRSTAAK